MAHYQSYHRRQLPTQITGVGINGASTVAGNSPTGTSLSLNPDATDVSDSPIPIAATVPTVTVTSSSSSTTPVSTADSESSSQTTTTSSGSNSISLGTVIGACVGALVGAIFLILLGLWVYKRTAPKPRERTPISPLAANRNARGEHERTRSRMEFWDKLEDGDQTKEVSRQSVGLMENLTMFKKSPSMRTAVTEKYQPPTFDLDSHPFAQYHPNLAKEMASEPEPSVRPFLGRVEAGPALSWDSGNASSFLSLHSRISGAMSSEGIAIPTPNVTASSEHRWESAEVLHYDDETAQGVDSHSNNPFNPPAERRKSFSNPFFGAQSVSLSRRSSSIRGSIRGREQDASDDPFADDKIPDVPKLEHVNSTPSVSSNERALQSLIAALDLASSDSELRVTSMQPSVYSATSMYTEDPEEDDVTESFPLPPGVNK